MVKSNFIATNQLTVGEDGEIYVKYTGTPPLTVEWEHNGEMVAATDEDASGSYIRRTIQSEDAGNWKVVVKNKSGEAEAELLVEVREPVRIEAQPFTTAIVEGGRATFEVHAEGTGLKYQWKFNGEDMEGETGSRLVIEGAGQVNVGKYRVVIENDFSSAVSEEARLNVSYKPDILNILTSDNNLNNSLNGQ